MMTGMANIQKYPKSLSRIGKEVGVHPSHVSKVLSGRPCRLELFEKIADSLEMTMDELRAFISDNQEEGAA